MDDNDKAYILETIKIILETPHLRTIYLELETSEGEKPSLSYTITRDL